MNRLRVLLYFGAFCALAAVTAAAVTRVGRPAADALLAAALLGSAAGAPGLLHRRAWPATFLLLPAAVYLLLRLALPPAGAHGLTGQASFYFPQLRAAGRAYLNEPFPLDFTQARLLALMTVVVCMTTGLASLLSLGLRRALAGIVVLLALLGYALTVDATTRVVWLPVAFVLLSGSVLMLSRALERQRWRPSDVLAGGATAVVALALSLSVLGATSVSAAKPWQDWRSWDPFQGVRTSRIDFDWMADFRGLLDPRHATEAMQVTSPVATYWRANSLNIFNGWSWRARGASVTPLQPLNAAGGRVFLVPPTHPSPAGRTVRETFTLTSVSSRFVFAGGWPTQVFSGFGTPVAATAQQSLRASDPLGPGTTYSVTATVPRVRPGRLAGLGRGYPADVTADLQLPFPAATDLNGPRRAAQWRRIAATYPAAREWSRLYRLNVGIVGSATDPYQIALRIERYLSRFTYTLTPPASSYRSPYAAFLFDTRTGFCQHFAGAMALLLRFNGVPARVAVGFATGRPAGRNTYVVATTDAHAWVEVYFPTVGWIPFDPTPGRGAAGGSAGFVGPIPAAGASASASATPADGGPGLQDRLKLDTPAGAREVTAPASGVPWWLPWPAAAAAIAFGWPAARALLRRRRLFRGSLEERLRASLALSRSQLRDFGVDAPDSQTLAETARYLADQLGIDAGRLVRRLDAVLYGGRAVLTEDLTAVARLRRQTARRLRRQKGWLRAVRAGYGVGAGR